MRTFFQKLRCLVKRRRMEDDLRDELQFHLAEETTERQANGMSVEEARLAARRELGNATLVQEEARSVWTWTWLEQLGQDCRYGLRTMVANAAFTLLATMSLALGIGANTAIFSFMDSLLMRSLPVPDPESLAVVNWQARPKGRDSVVRSMSGSRWRDATGVETAGIFPYPAFEILRNHSAASFSALFAYFPTRKVNVLVKNEAFQASGEFVSGEYFSGLGVTPAAGRMIVPADDRTGVEPVTVLSFAFSQRRFGTAADAVGQPILINNIAFTVVGVAAPGFFGVDPAEAPDFFIPLRTSVILRIRGGGGDAKAYAATNYYWLEMMGRLRPGVSLAQAQSALSPVFHHWVESTAANEKERAALPQLVLKEGAAGLDTLRRRYSKPLYVLLAMVGLMLAIACANIANLLLARGAARRREIAVRLGVGAGRWRVIRQLLTESVLLACAGGVAGVLLAIWGIRFLTVLLANGSEDFTLHAQLNWTVLSAACGLSLLTGTLFGLAPALQSTKLDVITALKESRTGQALNRHGLRRFSLGQALVVAQVGLSLLLLVGAGLFVRTLSNLQSIQLGFERENVLLFQLNARQAGHRDPEIFTFYHDLQQKFAAIPGVSSASASHVPLLGEGTRSGPVIPLGRERQPGEGAHILLTTPDFFTTMQIPLLLGRGVEQRDQPGSPLVAAVNEAYARKYFGDRNPVGERIHVPKFPDADAVEFEIVGVAKNVRYGAIKGEFREIVYLAYNQGADQTTAHPLMRVDGMTFALRTSGDPLRHVSTVREIVKRADPHVPVTSVTTQAARIDQTMNQEIIFARLCTGFAILALAIACVGLYGTMAYSVERRTSEIGIRMALGAHRRVVIWMVLRHACVLAAAGLAIGLPVALGTSKFIESFLFGVKANDALSMVGGAAILMIAALVASYVPARRASRIDPMMAVRHD